MFNRIEAILHQEILLYRSIRNNEIEKRRFILSAAGQKLEHLTRKSEILTEELVYLEKKRQLEIRELVGNDVATDEASAGTLNWIVELAAKKAPDRQAALQQLADQYRSAIHELKAEIDENERLLHTTSRSIGRFMENLKQSSAMDRDCYSEPAGSKKNAEKRQSQPVILNFNA